eukprot:CAMPEP_0206831860 /NCGR_PEP_ID=MMETSP0975-20121206/17601_1 /ASSEMBLY_ACC=CAM_ASM_000399 /TAXON_ID=483370 /ORGANISM="non described non described, Strain CCMP2097" /LENGTH=396 /DNA_ID=CAMNT_0054374247 /DNA_START=116 /DNA_END=1304 /DNA_ORIENTATION=+
MPPKQSHYANLLATLDSAPVEAKEEEVSTAELLRRERLEAKAVLEKAEAKAARATVKVEAFAAAAACEAARLLLAKLAAADAAKAARLRALEEEHANVERQMKRFFDVTDQRTGAVETTGGLYFGDHLTLGDDWLPDGYGELRYPSGETHYEGDWKRGQRHGAGTLRWDCGDKWEGTFHRDAARGLGVYKWAADEETGAARSNGTIVGRAALGTRAETAFDSEGLVADGSSPRREPVAAARNSDCKYKVHLDGANKAFVVDLATISFDLLYEDCRHRIEATQEAALNRYAPGETRSQPPNFYTPCQAPPAAKRVEDSARKAFRQRQGRAAFAADAVANADALTDSLALRAAGKKQANSRRAAFECRLRAAISEERGKRERAFEEKRRGTFLPDLPA